MQERTPVSECYKAYFVMNVKFSVLVANYNNGIYIRDALYSVLSQSYNSWEVILVDDASTDNSLEVIEPFLKDKRIKLYRNEINHGCGFTKSRCISLATGPICGFLDSDDRLSPDALKYMVDAHEKQPLYALINSTHYECDEYLNINQIAQSPAAIPDDMTYLIMPGRVSHFATFKINFYRRTGGIDRDLTKSVDQDLYYKLEDYGKIGFINKPLYFYRHHKNSISLWDNQLPAFLVHQEILSKAIVRRMSLYRQSGKIRLKLKFLLLERLHFAKYVLFKARKKYLSASLNAGAYVLYKCFGKFFV